jgi:hypothetical protein
MRVEIALRENVAQIRVRCRRCRCLKSGQCAVISLPPLEDWVKGHAFLIYPCVSTRQSEEGKDEEDEKVEKREQE